MSIISDLSNLKALQTVMPGIMGQNASLLVLLHNAVPCKASLLPEGGRAVPVAYTVIKPLTAGFATAPYYAVNSYTPPLTSWRNLLSEF